MSDHSASIPISVGGRYLWRGDDRLLVKGVAYQLYDTREPVDAIADDCLDQLQHDVLLFQELGLNTLFVYWIDNTKSHDGAMKLLEETGVYVLTTVSTLFNAINRLAPYESYNADNLTSFFKTVDVMASYPNTLGLLAGSEIVNNEDTVSATPVIKAVVRDVKKYIKMKHEVTGQRIIPIGYGASTTGARDQTILRYLTDGEPESIDFWTCKSFSWVGDSNMVKSGYKDMIAQLEPAGLPIFFSEYGDITHQPRLFQETSALYSEMCNILSGGIAYEFWQGSNSYGLVEALKRDGDTKWVSRRHALARADDPKKVYEKREMGDDTLLIFHDFINYKARLAASTASKSTSKHESAIAEQARERHLAAQDTPWPWEPGFQIPESCVDWEQVKMLMENER